MLSPRPIQAVITKNENVQGKSAKNHIFKKGGGAGGLVIVLDERNYQIHKKYIGIGKHLLRKKCIVHMSHLINSSVIESEGIFVCNRTEDDSPSAAAFC